MIRRRAVFLDRDGVINAYVVHPEFGTIDSPARANEFELLPGVGESIARCNRLGLLVVVASNQPGIAKGRFIPRHLAAMTSRMHCLVSAAGGRIDAVYYCRHHPEAVLPRYRKNCACRKPQPGLLLLAAEELAIDLTRSYFVGDGVVDIEAGRAAGCLNIFISSRKCYVCDELVRRNVIPDFLARNLGEAVDIIAALERRDGPAATRFAFSQLCSGSEVQ